MSVRNLWLNKNQQNDAYNKDTNNVSVSSGENIVGSMREIYEQLAKGLFPIADQVRDDGESGLEELEYLYKYDPAAAISSASDTLINHDVKLPDHLYELFKQVGQPGEYLDEDFADLEEIYLRK